MQSFVELLCHHEISFTIRLFPIRGNFPTVLQAKVSQKLRTAIRNVIYLVTKASWIKEKLVFCDITIDGMWNRQRVGAACRGVGLYTPAAIAAIIVQDVSAAGACLYGMPPVAGQLINCTAPGVCCSPLPSHIDGGFGVLSHIYGDSQV